MCIMCIILWHIGLSLPFIPSWHHGIKALSALLAFCERNAPVTGVLSQRTSNVDFSWWRNQMEPFSALLVTGEFIAQRPVTRSFDVFFDLRLNKRLSKQPRGWWFETPWRPLWRHCNELPWEIRVQNGGGHLRFHDLYQGVFFHQMTPNCRYVAEFGWKTSSHISQWMRLMWFMTSIVPSLVIMISDMCHRHGRYCHILLWH